MNKEPCNTCKFNDLIIRMAEQVDEMHRWFLGNGKVGLFEKIRELSLGFKILGIAVIILLFEAAISGRISGLVQLGLELVR